MAVSPAKGSSGPKEVVQDETRPAERDAVKPAQPAVHGEYFFRMTPEQTQQFKKQAIRETVLNGVRRLVDSAKKYLNPSPKTSEEKPQEAPPKQKTD